MTNKAKANAADKAMATAAEAVEKITAVGNETLSKVETGYEKASVASQANFDASLKASEAAVAGMSAYTEQVFDYTKNAFAENMELMQKAFAVKQPQDLVELQIEAANNSVNRVVAQATKLNEIAADTAAKTIEPLKAQMEKTVESLNQSFAA